MAAAVPADSGGMDPDTHVTLIGGPLDGMDIGTQTITDDPGAYMIVPGTDSRAAYEPRPGEDPTRWHFQRMLG